MLEGFTNTKKCTSLVQVLVNAVISYEVANTDAFSDDHELNSVKNDIRLKWKCY